MPSPKKIYYKRNLPHYQPPGGTFFVTFRLKNSVPMATLRNQKRSQEEEMIAKRDLSQEERDEYHLQHVFANDELLDKIKSGPFFLQEKAIAQLVIERIEEYDTQLYDLLSYCIMPNHVHLLIDTQIQLADDGSIPGDYVQLQDIMRLIKGGTATAANRLLNRSGPFWESESYDHWVRNEDSLFRIIAYIMENPCKANFVKRWQDWPYSYAKGYM
ncbi:MAG: transposase [Lewinella sp.]|jgi:REP element-mobilizing transposase RayT